MAKVIGPRVSIPYRLLAAISLAAVLSACNSAPPRDPDFAWVRPRPPQPDTASPGSLYQVGYGLTLFADQRARRVGDLLTIRLSEATNSSKKTTTKLAKTNLTTITNPTLLGSSVQFDTPNAVPLIVNSDNNLGTSLSSSHAFDGSGDTSQTNSLTGDISVTVAEVLPNGDLVVQGEKLLTLTEGHEYIRFSGVVRQADIAADNSVASTKVADARIIFAAEGATADANIIGWLSRFFMSVIFPF